VITYSFRANLFEKERVFRLSDGGLEIADADALPAALPLSHPPPVPVSYASIVEVRLSYGPTRERLNRYCCDLRLHNGRQIALCNESYRGFADFADQSARYRAFVVALHALIQSRGGPCAFRTGPATALFAFNVGCLGLGMLFLLWIVWLIPSAGLLVLVKLAFLAVYVPVMIHYFRANRPQSYSPDAIPARLLPS
jgi:hypothetical protein